MSRAWARRYGLGLFYVVGWLLMWGLHALLTWHNDTFFPHDQVPWAWNWLQTSFENLASEYHQILAFVVVTAFLVFEGSPESKDGDDRRDAALARIERRLERLEQRLSGSGATNAAGTEG